MAFRIVEDDLTGPEIAGLLREHLEHMHAQSPPESVHAMGIEALRAPDVTFWSAWDSSGSGSAELVGCGALKRLDGDHAEVKSMRTARNHHRRGVASSILTHILAVARERGHRRVSLETGSMEGFSAARALYERFGFVYTGPFGDYGPDPHSVFMTREL